MKRFPVAAVIILILCASALEVSNADTPITGRVYKYGLILDECVIDGKALKKERPGDWGHYCTISHGIEFGSDIDRRWMRIEFQYLSKAKVAEFTIYTSKQSRIGEWTELITFRKEIDMKGVEFSESKTWPTLEFDAEGIKLKFRFYHEKVR